MSTQVCRKCGREFPLDSTHFYLSSHNPLGFQFTCKECKGVSFETQIYFKEPETKVCAKCKRSFPCTDYYFYKQRGCIGGRMHECKECRGNEFGESNGRSVPDGKDGYKICIKCKRELPLNDYYFDRVYGNKGGFHGTCRKCRGCVRLKKKDADVVVNGRKKCPSCKQWVDIVDFSKAKWTSSGLAVYCKSCASKKYKANRVKVARRNKRWYKRNRDLVLKRNNKYARNRMLTDPAWRMQRNLRGRMRHLIKGNRSDSTCMTLVGCSKDELRRYVEELFKDGMTWDNYGIKGWHIDHIKPCAAFDLTDHEQQNECFHYTNLQPLWARDNIRKGAKYDE